MNLTPYRTPTPNETDISFPALECWNPMTEVATIAAQVSKRRVLCRISLEVLQEKFAVSTGGPMRVVVENRPTIESAARKLIENGVYEEDGSIIIRRTDI
ncbi:MAG: DUF1488 family protein [Gammaproteobacteria bacterium]